MTKPAVSIAMATYNGAPYLRAQLDSLAAQTLPPAELVVGDDGSTDGTLEILKEFKSQAAFPVHIHRNPQRLGYKANFMNVVRLCESPLISFCDQDDVWMPENLERVSECFEDPETLLVFHNAQIVDSDLRPISSFYHAPMPVISPRLTLHPWMYSFGFTQTFRAELVPAMELWGVVKDYYKHDQAMAHDLFFFLLASGLGNIHYIKDELTYYRMHARNTFGAGRRSAPNFLERWRYRLEDRSEIYSRHAALALLDTDLFAKLSELPSISPHLRQRAAEAAEAWRQIGPLYRSRADLYTADLPGRLTAFKHLYEHGAYKETSFWTFGTKAMMKDFILGVLFAPLLKTYGKRSANIDQSCRRGRNSQSNIDQRVEWQMS